MQTGVEPEQSPFVQQLPVKQEVPQHFLPTPQLMSVVQLPQLWFVQAPPSQSAELQQFPA